MGRKYLAIFFQVTFDIGSNKLKFIKKFYAPIPFLILIYSPNS